MYIYIICIRTPPPPPISEKRDTEFCAWTNRPTGSCLAHFYETS